MIATTTMRGVGLDGAIASSGYDVKTMLASPRLTSLAMTAIGRAAVLLTAVIASIGGGAQGHAQTAPVPYLKDQTNYTQRFLVTGTNRAFAVASDGRFAWVSHRSSPEQAIEDVLKSCNKDGKAECRVHTVNGWVVWDKDPRSAPLRDPAAPAIPPLVPADYVPIRGPLLAPGLVIWSHGYYGGIDATRSPPHGYVSRFMAAGWDVYRYNREWIAGNYEDVQGLLSGVRAARAAGYRKIILAGQSKGGWVSLHALGRGAEIDGVIATAPASHGNNPASLQMARARDDFRDLLAAIGTRRAAVPVAITLFEGDSYEPGGRRNVVADQLAGKIPLLFIDHPADFTGHGAGGLPRFNTKFGACLFGFATTADKSACP